MMKMRLGYWQALLACGHLFLCVMADGQTHRPLSDEDRQALQQGLQALKQSVRILADRKVENVADAAIFEKGVAWALKYDKEFSPTDVGLMQKAARRGRE